MVRAGHLSVVRSGQTPPGRSDAEPRMPIEQRRRRRPVTGDLQDPGVDAPEVSPVAPAPEPAPPEPRTKDLEALRERLKARGVLTNAPAVVIPKEPRPVTPAGDDTPA